MLQPIAVPNPTREDEVMAVEWLVRCLLEGRHHEHLPPLRPSDIGVLYKRKDPHALELLRTRLETLAPVVWIRGDDPDSRLRVLEPGIKLQTIHSAKGLQHRAVVLACADQLGEQPDTLDEDRRLLYVALARPEDVLAVTCTTMPREWPSPLLEELLTSDAFGRLVDVGRRAGG